MRQLAAAVLVALAATASIPATAADWFWRPFTGGPYGSANGRSYANAWHMSSAIAWNQIRPGDRLFVCGLHDGGNPDHQLVVDTSGTAAQPVTISGDCPGDPGAILATTGKWVDGWSGPDGNAIYTRDYSGRASQVIDKDGFLKRLMGLPGPSWPCRSFSQVDKIVYYKPCGEPQVLYPPGRSPVIRVIGRNYIHIDRLSLLNANKMIEVVDATGFRLTRSSVRYTANVSVLVRGSTSGGVLRDNQIRDVGEGPYFVTGQSNGTRSHDNWVVEGNQISDVYGTTDAHCIGWQIGSNNVIRNNQLRNCEGSGITFYDPGFGARIRNNVIENNVIADVRDTGRGGHNQRGIEINGINCPRHPDDSTGNVVRFNQISRVDNEGIYIKAGRPSSAGTYSWAITDNTLSAVKYGVVWIDGHWYGEPYYGSTNPDPCLDANLIPQLSAPGFIVARNTISGVSDSFLAPAPMNLQRQAADRSGILFHDNRYYGSAMFVWQGLTAGCPGLWESSLKRCTVDSLPKFQQISGKDQGSTQSP